MPVATLGQVKRLMNSSFYSTLAEQLNDERREIAIAADSAEGREGVAVFLHKRRPAYWVSANSIPQLSAHPVPPARERIGNALATDGSLP